MRSRQRTHSLNLDPSAGWIQRTIKIKVRPETEIRLYKVKAVPVYTARSRGVEVLRTIKGFSRLDVSEFELKAKANCFKQLVSIRTDCGNMFYYARKATL